MSKAQEMLAKARAAIAEQKNHNLNGPNELFRHWEIPFDGSCSLRFLPDGDEANPFFYKKKMMWQWDVITQAGEEKRLVTPCIKTFDPKAVCPAYEYLSSLFNKSKETGDDSYRKMAGPYWVNTTFLFQGFVRDPGFTEENPPESILRKFDISKQVFRRIENAIENTDEELALMYWPTDFKEGLNFIVKKTKNSDGYADYNQSSFSQRPTALTEEELETLADGIPRLDRYLPQKPTQEMVELQGVIIRHIVDGGEWNSDWNEHFQLLDKNGGSASIDSKDEKPVKAVKTISEDVDDEIPEVSDSVKARSKDIKALLKAKAAKTE